MKKTISILLVLVMLVSALPLFVSAEDSITEGSVTWSYDEATKTLAVSGEGDMPDYEWISTEDHRAGVSRLPKDWTSAEHVVVEEGITSIGDWAFIWFEKMTDITLPESLTKIGNGAFENTYLYSIEFPASLTELEGCFCTTEPPKFITFKGDAPNLDNWTNFNKTVTMKRGDLTTILYPEDNATWTEDVKSAFGPRIAWNGELTDRAVAAEIFEDVKDSYWYYDSLQFVYEQGLMIGTTATTFAPDAGLTRAQAIQMLFNMSGEYPIDYSGETSFKDVSAKAWCASAVNWAADKGITKGVSATEFAPNKLITRQELATMLKSFADYMECTPIEGADISEYEDAGKVANWAYNPVRWCVSTGIISGMTETTLAPNANTNRAQTARMLSQFYTFVLDNMPTTVSSYNVIANFMRAYGERSTSVSPESFGVYYYTIEEGDKMFVVDFSEHRGKKQSLMMYYYPEGTEVIKEGNREFESYFRTVRITELKPSYNCVFHSEQPSYRLIATGALTPDGFDDTNERFSYRIWNGTKYEYDESKDIYGYEKRDEIMAEALEYIYRFLSDCGLEYKDLFING